MAIVKDTFARLVESKKWLNGNDFDDIVNNGGREATETALKELKETAEDINNSWEIETIENKHGRNFEITEDLKFRYRTTRGKERERDISSYAFQQLCTRMGIPSNYLMKCAEAGKQDLILDNFKAWADDYKGELSIMSNGVGSIGDDKITRAVMSSSFERFDYGKVISNLTHTIDLDRWVLIQNFLSEDMMVLRFIDAQSPYYVDDNSQNYIMATVITSDVGKSGLHINLSSYRRTCTNGMIVAGRAGTLYSQAHAGKEMRKSKIIEFSRAFDTASAYGGKFAESIEKCRREVLNKRELELWLEKAKHEIKLNKEKMGKLETLIGTTYDSSVWGVANGVTELAQDFTLDTRLAMETWAGNVLSRNL